MLDDGTSRSGWCCRSRSRPPASCCAPSSSSTTARTARSCRPSAATTSSAPSSGVVVFTPFQTWRHSHAVHHATAGDLDRRGTGDVPTMTARGVPRARPADARSATAPSATRSSCSASAGCGASSSSRGWSARTRARASSARTWVTNLVLAVIITGLCLLVGPGTFFLVQGPGRAIAGAAGVFLFYVQHSVRGHVLGEQQQSTWSYADAALRGVVVPEAAAAVPVLHGQHRPAPRPPPLGARAELQPAGRARQHRRSSTTCRC